MKQKVTLRQIAELAGISANSVSKALKDSPSISKEMKEKVREIANQLGYFPNSHAQSLRSGSSHVIAILPILTIKSCPKKSITSYLQEDMR